MSELVEFVFENKSGLKAVIAPPSSLVKVRLFI